MLDAGERALALVISLIEKLGYCWCEEHLEVFKDRCPICLKELMREREHEEVKHWNDKIEA